MTNEQKILNRKESVKKYNHSSKEKETAKRYRQSPKGKEYYRKYRQSVKGKECQKKYRQSPKRKKSQKKYQQSPKGKKSTAKRRYLGFISLNEPFEGCEGHHIDFQRVIYIPKELHHSIWHSLFLNINMDEINRLAFDSLELENRSNRIKK